MLVEKELKKIFKQLLQEDVQKTQGPELATQCHSRAEVHSRFMHKVQQEGAAPPQGLPPRIVVFGISNLPMQVVEALAALGRWRQIILMVQNPCQEYWGHDMDLQAQKHSLLSSWSCSHLGNRVLRSTQDSAGFTWFNCDILRWEAV